MGLSTPIEWTHSTWNPLTGCTKISPGCKHCYAERMSKRLKAMGQPKYQRDGDRLTSGPGFRATVHAASCRSRATSCHKPSSRAFRIV